MKITLSKTQWEFLGKQAGWVQRDNLLQEIMTYPPNKVLDALKAIGGTEDYQSAGTNEIKDILAIADSNKLFQILDNIKGQRAYASSVKKIEKTAQTEELVKTYAINIPSHSGKPGYQDTCDVESKEIAARTFANDINQSDIVYESGEFWDWEDLLPYITEKA